MKRLLFTLLFLVTSIIHVFAQQTYYDVTSGTGNGLRFWSSDNYKIHMGNSSLYKYGPVTDYSIKMNMNDNNNRGWTWGKLNQAPIAALSAAGQMQIAGGFTSMSNGVFNGSLAVGISSPGSYKMYVNGNTYSNGSITFPTVAYNGTTSMTHLSFPVLSDGFYIMTQQLSSDIMEAIFRLRDNTTGDSFRMWFDDYRGESYDRNPLIVYGNKVLLASDGGNVGIGLTAPAYKLDVDGIVRAEEIKVQTVPASDYVFEPDYNLLPLTEVESFIQQNKHLPDIPSALEFKENGVGLGEMDDMLLRKVEELTLYVIEQNKKLDAQSVWIEKLLEENLNQEQEIQHLKTKLDEK